MARHYDSSRRRQAAAETRRSILQAALKLHWQGITEYAALAREVGCSVPTVRKHFPSRELLFRDCTRTFAESLAMPDMAAMAGISDPERRLLECVSELCRMHEAMFGYAWFGAHARRESPTLDGEMKAYEGLADAIADIIAPDHRASAPVLRGLLDFLTWRALRLSGGLSPAAAQHQLVELTRPLVTKHQTSSRSSNPEEGGQL